MTRAPCQRHPAAAVYEGCPHCDIERLSRPSAHEREPPHCATCECGMAWKRIVAVSGGRTYDNKRNVWRSLDQLHAERTIDLLVHGQCYRGGADEHARLWAVRNEVNCLSVPAKTGKYGFKRAGPIRNREIGAMAIRDWVLFPGGPGTAHARAVAVSIRAKLLEVTDEGVITQSSV